MLTKNELKEIRKEFPITGTRFPVLGGEEKSLIYLDHAASTHPSRRVLSKHVEFLEHYYANIHRGNHNLSLIASEMFDNATDTLATLIHGNLSTHVMIMTSNTTDALNLASHVMASHHGITLCTSIEHHSNDLPHRHNGKVEYVKMLPDGSLDMTDLEAKLKAHKVRLVAVTGASNVTGYLPDIYKIAKLAHQHGARILVDAAQLLAHHSIDVEKSAEERIDFLAAAGHKAYAPFGSGFLYGPRELLDKADPFSPGGGTVVYVTHQDVLYSHSPDRHEGGTPNIAGAVAFAESIRFLQEVGMDAIRKHELELLKYALDGLKAIDGVHVYGPLESEKRIGVIPFNILDLSHELVSAILNYEGAIATRNGCFCAHPYVLSLLGITDTKEFQELTNQRSHNKENPDAFKCTFETLPGAVRASLGIYNTEEEIEEFLRMVRVIRDKKWQGNYRFLPTGSCSPSFFEVHHPT